MDLQQLTQEMKQFVNEMGWYDENSPKPQTPRNLAISLVIESGEVLELFQWPDQSPSDADLGSELADVALYLLQLANESNIDLESAILGKLQENYGRSW